LVIVSLAALPLFADGAALYKSKCAMCHGADGSGNTPVGKSLHLKSLGAVDVQKLTDAELSKIIREGKGKMPAFAASKLTDTELAEVVHVIRSFAPQK
jgi:cytochrome c6